MFGYSELSLSLCLSLRWVSWYQNVSILDFTGAEDDGGGGDNWNQSNLHHQQTNIQHLDGLERP